MGRTEEREWEHAAEEKPGVGKNDPDPKREKKKRCPLSSEKALWPRVRSPLLLDRHILELNDNLLRLCPRISRRRADLASYAHTHAHTHEVRRGPGSAELAPSLSRRGNGKMNEVASSGAVDVHSC